MRLARHLTSWLGTWPPQEPVEVVGSAQRTRPGWDGTSRPFLGVEAPALGMVLSVPPELAEDVRELVTDQGWTADVRTRLARELGGGTIAAGTFRAANHVPDRATLPDVGTWVEPSDPRLPDWLRPFNGGVLLAVDAEGQYVAGLGVKRHDDVGRELSVGTEPGHRGRGLARRLVAQAARELLSQGAAVTYLHDPVNTASARVAAAAGFPDLGWRIWGLFRPDPDS